MTKKLSKKKHLIESKTFCLVPWTHVHTTPTGVAAPCCISESCASVIGIGDAKRQSLMSLVNSRKMNQLRLDMIAGIKNPECSKCHRHEDQGVTSFRQMMNEELKEYFVEATTPTNKDGSLEEFKMKYFDIRFNNICNFKCRTCGSSFSTQWEQEDLKAGVGHAKIIPKNNNKSFLNDVIEQVDNFKVAYFAGGEPLITEEHYILLEEMIKRKKTDIVLRYNTNLSNLKFKDKDLLSLWKHFTNRVDIYASIDHYGERAEYIRHGTDWGVVETNFKIAKQTSFISVQMNTVLSVFNYLTIYEFYDYLIKKGLYDPSDQIYTLYNMATPPHLTCHILPPELKAIGKEKMEKAITLLKDNKFSYPQVKQLTESAQWTQATNTWDQYKHEFKREVRRIDKLRNENFRTTFPELADLLADERKKMWPV